MNQTLRYKGYEVFIFPDTDMEHGQEVKVFGWSFSDPEGTTDDWRTDWSCGKTIEQAFAAAKRAINKDIIRQELASGEYN